MLFIWFIRQNIFQIRSLNTSRVMTTQGKPQYVSVNSLAIKVVYHTMLNIMAPFKICYHGDYVLLERVHSHTPPFRRCSGATYCIELFLHITIITSYLYIMFCYNILQFRGLFNSEINSPGWGAR